MKWISLDISTKSTGYAVYQGLDIGKCKLLKSGHLDGVGKKAKARFPELIKNIINILKTESPDTVVVEAAFYRTSFKSIEYLLKLQGCVEAYCRLNNIIFDSIETTTWRSKLNFPTNFKKNKQKCDYKSLSIECANRVSNKQIISDDEADAVCIGLAWWLKMNKDIVNINIA